MYLSIIVLSYLCGAIPFGVIVGKIRGVDVRAVGSGNIGATNVWRALGPVAGGTVFALDMLKGVGATCVARMLLGDRATRELALCAVCVVAGHIFSIFLKFRGGKGIATGVGAIAGLAPIVAAVSFAVWGLVLAVSRTISVASIAACLTVVAVALATHQPRPYLAVMVLMVSVALVKHIPNMRRIAAGTEPRLGARSGMSAAAANNHDVTDRLASGAAQTPKGSAQ